MLQQLFPALRMTIFLTILTGLIYPGAVTGLCQMLFTAKANGSLVIVNGQVAGSELIGQNFRKPQYFHARPSAAGSVGYDASASGGSNLGPTNRKLIDRVRASADQFRKDNPTYKGDFPADAVTASGSGLDPHISLANAEAQAARVATARQLTSEQVREAIAKATEGRGWGFLGETVVNVLSLNIELDRLSAAGTVQRR